MKNDNSFLDQFSEETPKLWRDRKRYFGLPISFTVYSVSTDRIFVKQGLLFDHRNETLLYRVKDVSISRSFIQKLFGVGTVTIQTLDQSTPYLYIKNVARPEAVKEMLHRLVEDSKSHASIEQILG